MKVLVLNGSPAGEDSVTLYTVKYIEKRFSNCEFEVVHVARRIRAIEQDFSACAASLNGADLILFCYPVYTFLVPAQLHQFIEMMKALDLAGKTATQVTTSKHFYDVTAHRFIQDNCDDMGLNYIQGLSADMEDLLRENGRREALDWFRHVLWSMENGWHEPAFYGMDRPAPEPVRLGEALTPATQRKGGEVVVVTDMATDTVRQMVERFTAILPHDARVVDISTFDFAGGCLGCFNCAADGKCVYRDGFDEFLRQNIQQSSAIVYAFAVKDHSMGYRFKLFDDRQFCNGHRTVTMGRPVGYLVDGSLRDEPNLRMLLEARAQVGGNQLAGVACSRDDPQRQIARMAAELSYAIENDYRQPGNFFGVGGMKIFRDLIYMMRGLMRADHKFYRQHGFYDFPQKRPGRIIGMYAVGAMMNSKALKKKIGGRMTEGMVGPYKKAVEK